MSSNKNEDFEDAQEIKRQKHEHERSGEEYESWELGKGVVTRKEDSKNVRNKVQ